MRTLRQKKWNGARREHIDLFNVSIRSEILVPYRKRQAKMKYEVFLKSCPTAIRKWIADEDDDEDDDDDDDDDNAEDDDDDGGGARCLDNHDVDSHRCFFSFYLIQDLYCITLTYLDNFY